MASAAAVKRKRSPPKNNFIGFSKTEIEARRVLERMKKLEKGIIESADEIKKVCDSILELKTTILQASNGGMEEDTNKRLKDLEVKAKEAEEFKLELQRLKCTEDGNMGGSLDEKVKEVMRVELPKLVKDDETRADKIKEQVRMEMSREREAWKVEDLKDKQCLREIMNQEMREQQQGMEKKSSKCPKNEGEPSEGHSGQEEMCDRVWYKGREDHREDRA